MCDRHAATGVANVRKEELKARSVVQLAYDDLKLAIAIRWKMQLASHWLINFLVAASAQAPVNKI